jgi:uncharacterized glyoxalase superfamily protein PhnB
MHLELHVPDFNPVKEFYGRLGFSVVWERKPEGYKGYLVMERTGAILCFWAGNEEVYTHSHFKKFPSDTPRGYGVEIIIGIEDVEAFHDQIKGFAEVVDPLVTQPWGLKDFRIVDPFGYYIRFTEPHDVRSPDFAVE